METGDACAGLLGTFRSQHVLLLVLSCIKHVGLSGLSYYLLVIRGHECFT